MNPAALLQQLQQAVPSARLESAPSIDLQPTIVVDRESAPAVLRTLCDNPDLRFAFLAELTAIDVWPREPRFEVVYILVSIEHRARLRLRVTLPGDAAHIATASSIWPGANWLEREVWDMFGIFFDGHPDLRRLLMPDDWEGHPLRKDYPVQIRKKPETFEPLQVSEEEFRANVARDRQTRGVS